MQDYLKKLHQKFEQSYFSQRKVVCQFEAIEKIAGKAESEAFGGGWITYNLNNIKPIEYAQLVVAHEYAHLLQDRYTFYSTYRRSVKFAYHQCAFFFLFNALSLRHFDRFEFRTYDVKEDPFLQAHHFTTKNLQQYEAWARELVKIQSSRKLCEQCERLAEKVYLITLEKSIEEG